MEFDCTKDGKNIYFVCREKAAKYNDLLNSRERAAELLGISTSTLANHELGVTKNIPPDTVVMMSDLYKTPELRSYYCKHECPIGRNLPLAIQVSGLQNITIKILNSLDEDAVRTMKKQLLSIAEDGEVTADTRKGDYPLTDPRDIYEAVANQAARRVRACILGIIPSDVVEAAVDRCNKTLREGYEEPLVDRVRKMAEVFEKEFSVNISMIEKYLGCKSDAFSENDFVRLKKVYRTLRDGMAKREDYFEIGLPVTDNSEISDPFSGGEKKQEASKEGDKK